MLNKIKTLPAPVEDNRIATTVIYLWGHEVSAAIKYSSVYKVPLSTVAPKSTGNDRYINEVTIWALNVPIGIFFEGSSKSPDLLEPAIIPVTDGK